MSSEQEDCMYLEPGMKTEVIERKRSIVAKITIDGVEYGKRFYEDQAWMMMISFSRLIRRRVREKGSAVEVSDMIVEADIGDEYDFEPVGQPAND